jgi:hypothetical protein
MAIVREGAVTSLAAYGVTADGGTVPVESERMDVVQNGDMPRILVFGDDSGQLVSKAGTAPAFDITGTLVIQCFAQRAVRTDVLADIDAMIAQVKDCLFCDAVWLALSSNVMQVRVTKIFKYQGERFVGDARVQIDLAWREVYPPRVTQALTKITLTSTPPAGTQAIAAGATLATS